MSDPSRVFLHPNMTNFVCPVCRTSADAPVFLVPIPGTEDDGIVECRQVHTDCWRLIERMNALAPKPQEVERG